MNGQALRSSSSPAAVAHQPWQRGDSMALAGCVTLAVLLGVLPHVANWICHGTFQFLADNDDVFYMALARPAYHGEWGTRDVFAAKSENLPALHAWFQIVPWGKLAGTTGIPLIYLGLVWRLVGSAMFAGSTYWLLRTFLGRTARPVLWTTLGTVLALTDAGLLGRMGVDSFLLFYRWLQGAHVEVSAMHQYRVVTPLTNAPLLLILAGCVVPARLAQNRFRVLAAGALGLTILIYFFFWTAAVGSLAGYAAVVLALAYLGKFGDEQQAMLRTFARGLVAVLVVGILIGSPQIWSNARAFFDPEFRQLLELRAQRPVRLAPGDPHRWMHAANMWNWLRLLAGALAVFGLRKYRLAFLWSLVAAGFLLTNSAIVTGLEFENFHWNYVIGLVGTLLMFIVAAEYLDAWLPCRFQTGLAAAISLAFVLFAFLQRWDDSQYARDPAERTRSLKDLAPLVQELAKIPETDRVAGPSPDLTVAMLYGQFPPLFNMPYGPMALLPRGETERRDALDEWLRGLAAPSPQRELEKPDMYAERQRQFALFLGDPEAGSRVARELSVRYLLAPASAAAPVRGGPWKALQRGEGMVLWKRDDADRAPASAP